MIVDMKNSALVLGLVTVLLAGCGGGSSSTPTTMTPAAPVPVASSPAAPAPASTAFTLPEATIDGSSVYESTATNTAAYEYSTDSAGHATCTSTGGCLGAWPAVIAPAGVTLTAPWSSFMRADNGEDQLEYNGHPLYTFSGDSPANPGTADNANVPSSANGTFTFAAPQAAPASTPAPVSPYARTR